MRIFHPLIFLVAFFISIVNCFAQQNPSATFAQVINQYFSQWDANGDGVLSKQEIEAAVANPKIQDEAAAAIAIIRMVEHGGKYKLQPITKAYLVSATSAADETDNSGEDLSKPSQTPAFQPRYLHALKRLRQSSRELFPESLPSLDAIHQEGLGDCSFLSTVGGMVQRNPSAIKSMFTQNDDGSTAVTFGNGQKIKIAHVTDADIVICSTDGKNGLWLVTLEKAYRKFLLKEHSSQQEKSDIYDRMNGSAVEILDGRQTKEIKLRKLRDNPQLEVSLRKDLKAALRENRLVKAGTPEIEKTPGITGGHDYAILRYDNETGSIHVWNPHSNNFTPKGLENLQNGYITKAGQFDIPLKDFIQIFVNVTIETQK